MARFAFCLPLLTLLISAGGCANNASLNNSALLGTASLTTSSAGAQAETPFNPFADEAGSDIKRRKIIENPTLEQIMQPGPLPEMTLGRADAPVTIIKYASMTCPYCREFQIKIFPTLKREYIDTGKVRYILREFPIGFQSGAATIALRCVPANKYFTLYDKFMRQQRRWVSQEVRRGPIFQVAKQVGLSRAKFDSCFADETLSQNLNQIKERGRTLGIIGTPNYFIAGRLYKRRLTMRDMRNLINEALAEPVASVQKN